MYPYRNSGGGGERERERIQFSGESARGRFMAEIQCSRHGDSDHHTRTEERDIHKYNVCVCVYK